MPFLLDNEVQKRNVAFNFVKMLRFVQESEKSKKTIASIIERPSEKSAKLLKEKEEQQKHLKQKSQEKVVFVKTDEPKLTNGYDIRLLKDTVILFLRLYHNTSYNWRLQNVI